MVYFVYYISGTSVLGDVFLIDELGSLFGKSSYCSLLGSVSVLFILTLCV